MKRAHACSEMELQFYLCFRMAIESEMYRFPKSYGFLKPVADL